MKRLLYLCAWVPAIAFTTACGGGEVVVLAQIERTSSSDGEGGGFQPLGNLEIQLLPYDRDAIFDSLAAAHPQPEPTVPDTLQVLLQAISAAQREVQQTETRWLQLRDSLQTLSDRMSRMNRSSPEYTILFRDFSDLEGLYEQAERESKAAFDRYTALQSEFNTMAQEFRLRMQVWEDEAFADVFTVMAAKAEEAGRTEVYDTTGSDGVVAVVVKPGRWWVHARYPLVFEELYWNVPIEVQRGERVEIQLSNDNAQIRPRW